jgi:hypothetical protein
VLTGEGASSTELYEHLHEPLARLATAEACTDGTQEAGFGHPLGQIFVKQLNGQCRREKTAHKQ